MTETVKVAGDAPLVEASSDASAGSSRAESWLTCLERPQLHPARAAADGRGATDGWCRGRGRKPPPGASVRRQWYAPRAEHVPRRRRAEREPHGRRVCVEDPVDAIAEFRIFSQSAPAEYGGTAGATTSVVTRSGSNQFHGTIYDFVRNDKFDARNFFSEKVEPLEQNEFGGATGGPITRDRFLFFGYYEGLRNRQGTYHLFHGAHRAAEARRLLRNRQAIDQTTLREAYPFQAI